MAGRRLYLCTPDRPDLAEFLEACIGGGVDIVQLREKRLEARDLVARARLALAVCGQRGVPFVLNDRADLALEVGADGVHVGQEDALVSTARRILGPGAIVGLSTHTREEMLAGLLEPVDYLSAGPVVETPTKPGRPGTGFGYVSEVAKESTVPWFVTGGVTPETVPGLVGAGARRFVVVRYLTESADPRHGAERLTRAIDEALGGA